MTFAYRKERPVRIIGSVALILLMAGLILARTEFRLAIVVGTSMLPQFQTGDVLLVKRRAYQHLPPQRGDVVLARHGKDLIVKRVIGLPGEEVALRSGRLFINGSAFPEWYPTQPGALNIASGWLFADKFALLGDNREAGSCESVHAVLPKKEIVGRVVWAAGFHKLPKLLRTTHESQSHS